MSRFRLRQGRRARYFPTTAEETAFGAGPYGATITAINADGSVNLAVDVPAAIATVGDADGTYGQDPEGDLINELRDRELLRYKAAVTQGGAAGQFDLLAGSSAV